jgi:hypothetical protein
MECESCADAVPQKSPRPSADQLDILSCERSGDALRLGLSVFGLRAKISGEASYGAPGGARTPDLLIRSQSLYPAELRARAGFHYTLMDGMMDGAAR